MKVWLKVAPVFMFPESKVCGPQLPVHVTVCWEPPLVHVTVEPSATVTVFGLKKSSPTMTLALLGEGVAVGEGVGGVVGVGVGGGGGGGVLVGDGDGGGVGDGLGGGEPDPPTVTVPVCDVERPLSVLLVAV